MVLDVSIWLSVSPIACFEQHCSAFLSTSTIAVLGFDFCCAIFEQGSVSCFVFWSNDWGSRDLETKITLSMQNGDEWQSDKGEQKLKALLPTQKIV